MAATPLAAENPTIAIDEDVEDEAVGFDVASDTTSLKSYALKYEHEYGRRFNSAEQSKYFWYVLQRSRPGQPSLYATHQHVLRLPSPRRICLLLLNDRQ
jgi:hypothetical protein